ncbi:hypothetical protein [Azospirillum doebereinerae]|uniref:Uncharacterized protein n=1 Tax=Azospirillum doebereinerae TaxID=92933 RepID=A0A3S0WUB3_9PROT|nr:hypothetical protein [Azospirillum doebereinerae]MCG5243245.1 hypothetical protein [Azospirillum doebereinerae]RUQ69695.1 hypothetical protein EJ913_15120 [Azospirillum doebereinerae]
MAAPSSVQDSAPAPTPSASVWIPVPEAMAFCVEITDPVRSSVPVGKLWDRMSGAWLTRCRHRKAA